jgi:putative oxidoreductase
MKKLITVNKANTATDLAILIARIAIGAMMLNHGFPKMLMLFSGAPVQFPGLFGLNAETSLALAVFAEVFCSLFLILGLATRLAAIPLTITMLTAVLMIHGADPFKIKEVAVLYLLIYTVLLFTGSGRFSIDQLLSKEKMHKAHAENEDPTLLIYE